MTEDDPSLTESTHPSDESPSRSTTLNNAISRVVPDNLVKVLGGFLLHVVGMLIAMLLIGGLVYILRHSVPTDGDRMQGFYAVITMLTGLSTYHRHRPEYIHETPALQSRTGKLDALLRTSLDALLFYSILSLAMVVLLFFSLQDPAYSSEWNGIIQMWVVFKAITLVPLTVFMVKSFKSMRAQAVNTARQLYLDKPE